MKAMIRCQRESRVMEGGEKSGSEKENNCKDQNKEQNEVRTLVLLRLEFLT